MCAICDGYSEEQVRRATELHIITHGWALTGVYPGADGEPDGAHWSYTIGLTESFGLPELVVTDIEFEEGGRLLNWAGDRLAKGDSLDDLDVGWALVHQTHLEGELFNGWANYYDRSPGGAEFVQLVVPEDYYCSSCARKQHADLADPFEEFPANRPIAEPG